MPTNQLGSIIHHLRSVLARQGNVLTDRQLLENFLNRRDDTALKAVMARHGPMVWGVCRRLLYNYQDAEDAFQATFLVFIRKAGSIAVRETVANWLYGVAYKIAWKAKTMVAKRKVRERQVEQMPEPETIPHEPYGDWLGLLDQELNQLPDRYREVVVLCDLQGRSYREAAQQLGAPEGTVATRLARARRRLAQRLERRGVAISAGALAQQAASDQMPTRLMASTLKAASLLAAGQTAAAAFSPQVIALTEGALEGILLHKLKVFSLGSLGLIVSAWILVAAGQAVCHRSCPLSVVGYQKSQLPSQITDNRQQTIFSRAVAQPVGSQDTGGIDPRVIAAWEKVGARFGWLWHKEMWVSPKSNPLTSGYFSRQFTADRPKGVAAMPGFQVQSMALPVAPTPPMPSVPFVLDGSGRQDPGFLSQLPGLDRAHVLILQNAKLSKTDWKKLVGLKQLRSLNLRGTKINDQEINDLDVKELAGLQELRTLDLRYASAGDEGLRALAKLIQLQSLILESTPITDAGLKELASLQHLQSLCLYGCRKITDLGLQELTVLKQLRSLRIDGTQVTDAGLRTLAGLRHLHTLHLEFNNLSDAGCKELVKCQQLRFLNLSFTQISDAGLQELAGLKHLQTLELRQMENISAVGLKALAALTELQELYLADSKVGDRGLKELAGLQQLRALELTFQLWGTEISDEGLKELAGLKKLQALYLGATQAGDEGLKALAGLDQLQTLELQHTPISDLGLQQLAGLKRLKQLNLEGNQISDQGLKVLAGLTQLQHLNLTGTQVSDRGLKALTPLKELRSLDLEQTQVGDRGLKNLLVFNQLKYLNLAGTQVSDAGLKELAALERLQHSDLARTRVSDTGLKELTAFRQLQMVDLRQTQVTDAGVAELKSALPWLKVSR